MLSLKQWPSVAFSRHRQQLDQRPSLRCKKWWQVATWMMMDSFVSVSTQLSQASCKLTSSFSWPLCSFASSFLLALLVIHLISATISCWFMYGHPTLNTLLARVNSWSETYFHICVFLFFCCFSTHIASNKKAKLASMENWKCWPWPGRALNLLAKLACACMCENSRYYWVSLGFCCSISRLFIHWTEFNYIRLSEQMMLLMLASKTVTDLGCRTKKSECLYNSFRYGHLHAPINAAKSHLPKLIAIKRRRAQESTIFSCSAIADDWSAIEFKVHLWCQNCIHRDRQTKTEEFAF